MQIKIITHPNEKLIEQLTIIWENSVRATHSFLTEDNIQYFKNMLPEIFTHIPHLIVAIDENNQPLGFMGINDSEIEMLFIDGKKRGLGIGKKLILFGIDHYQVSKLTVNEQNPQAIGFYEHLGFTTYQRNETDDQGQPFPVLKMKLIK